MSKRFIDISILPKAWRKLEPSLKITWFYLWNHCDAAGVWEIDRDLFEFENGFEIDLDLLKKHLPEEFEVSGNLLLMKNFISINYTQLKENYNPHKPTYRAINRHNLKLNSSLNQACFKLEEEDEDEEEEEGKDEDEKKSAKEKSLMQYTNQNEIDQCLKKCVEFFPEHLRPGDKQKKSWVDTIEKLNRIEKIPFDKIIEIVKKTRADDFWSKNFLSLVKLRKKNKEGLMYVVVFNENIKSKPTNKGFEADQDYMQTVHDSEIAKSWNT
ncbi:hypothetical protein [Aquimarina intermedia]|uniref:Uncharacterized protein n=1 Tax=Aquimarina intermedia TaxID=350814 RepID=A0A5S5BZL4_9FLAO|nr:hypothetical protein [Aquimarina intermedia]TYP71510.1 hypothetical protein BD809_10992 [Aquimarina intermedia]